MRTENELLLKVYKLFFTVFRAPPAPCSTKLRMNAPIGVFRLKYAPKAPKLVYFDSAKHVPHPSLMTWCVQC